MTKSSLTAEIVKREKKINIKILKGFKVGFSGVKVNFEGTFFYLWLNEHHLIDIEPLAIPYRFVKVVVKILRDSHKCDILNLTLII